MAPDNDILETATDEVDTDDNDDDDGDDHDDHEDVDDQASVPVLASQFLAVLNHCGVVGAFFVTATMRRKSI